MNLNKRTCSICGVTGHMKNNKLFHNDKNPLVIEKSKMINI